MVAIKTAKEAQGEGADDMVKEATVMSQVKPHPNLVSLIGVVTSGLPLLLLISMCEHGSVQSLLQDRALAAKAKQCAPLSFAERAKICLETARGMAYLIASRFIHRDLASDIDDSSTSVLVSSRTLMGSADPFEGQSAHPISAPSRVGCKLLLPCMLTFAHSDDS